MALPVAAAVTGAALVMVANLALVSATSQFFRNSVGVIATTLTTEFTLTAAELGFLSSVFFLVFSVCQVPVGVVIDRYGPRAAILGSALFVVAGSLLFSVATDYPTLIAARLMMGIGCSTFLMAPLVLYAHAFEPRIYASLTGVHVALSSLGSLAATAPLAYATALSGWRWAFVWAAIITAISALLVIPTTKDVSGTKGSAGTETLRETISGLGAAIRTPGFLGLFAMQFSTYSTFAMMLGLWGGPYLAHVHGGDLATQGHALLALAGAQVVGVMVWGSADRWVGAYRPVVLTAATLSVGCLLALIFIGHRVDTTMTLVLMAALGFACAYTAVLMAHGKSLFAPALTGRGMTLLNIGTMGGSFTMQALTGLAVKAVAGPATVYPVAAFQAAFALQILVIIGTALLYMRAPDPRRAMG
ncbi:MAG: MFS transporter [Alphaproteobacteria bacterium]